MASARHHHPPARPASESPGWSLLRLSAWQRLGLALLVSVLLWASTAAVIL